MYKELLLSLTSVLAREWASYFRLLCQKLFMSWARPYQVSITCRVFDKREYLVIIRDNLLLNSA